MTNSKLFLSARHVTKSYGDTPALKGIDLDLYAGEILALLGPNGAGKTTFIKIIATLLAKTAGRVQILGHDLDQDLRSIRHLFGYVGQDTDRSAYARLTVRQNLQFFGLLRGLNKRTIQEQQDKLAGFFDFRENLDKLFMHLSGGQKQTVVIMRALLHDPPIIYLDEPTKGLDPIIGKKIRAFLKTYVHQENKALLLTSHILTEVDEMADRVALIHDGRIGVVGTPSELKQSVGAAHFIELERDKVPTAVCERITALPSVTGILERELAWLSFGLDDPFAGTEAVMRILQEENIVTKFRNQGVSLEDAFIHHIGALNSKFD